MTKGKQRVRVACGISALAVAVMAGGCSSSGSSPLNSTTAADGGLAAASVPLRITSYIDLSLPHAPLADIAASTGVHRFVMSFAMPKDGACVPVWDSTIALTDPKLLAQVAALRAAGGTVTAATGGAQGSYLENVCPTADALANAYRQVLSVSGADQLDVDIEQRVPIDLLADALTTMRRQGVPITVTLPVDSAQQGLESDGLSLLRALAQRGTDVTVNGLLMDMSGADDWQRSLLGAAEKLTDQVSQIWPSGGRQAAYHRVGLTIMAGRNDNDATTTVADAQALAAYARSHGIASLGLWSVARDNGGCAGNNETSAVCSGIAQKPYEFMSVLAGVQR